MVRWISLLLSLPLTACWGKGPSVEQTFEETYLPYRVPGDDPAVPAMYVLRDDGGGKLQQLIPKATELPEPHVLRWGVRYVVKVWELTNPTWGTSSRRITDVLREDPVTDLEFTLPSIAPRHFGADRRSFIDGQAFVCEAPICQSIDAAIDKGEPFDLVMRFGPTPGVAPIALRVDTRTTDSGTE